MKKLLFVAALCIFSVGCKDEKAIDNSKLQPIDPSIKGLKPAGPEGTGGGTKKTPSEAPVSIAK